MDDKTAQVTPLEITTKLIQAAQARGAQLRTGVAVKGVTTTPLPDKTKKITSIQLEDDTTIPCDILVLAMGPWTTVAASDWLNVTIPMNGIKSTSITYPATSATAPIALQHPYALFCEEDKHGCHLEVYPRPNGEVYLCGLGGSDVVTAPRLRSGGDCARPEHVKADPARVKAARDSFGKMTTYVHDIEPASQACMRPCTPDGLPVIGAVPTYEGVYVSAGHNCWGILWGPVTGLAMSELILEGTSKCVDLNAFWPGRFMESVGNRGRKKNENDVGEQW
eukprot:TRINITY_DN10303_c0_g1_i1.p1 TRINITY_DN10303_c0_g1~~TRINITY_DN10303_c0_g1_i1.p1  ORF type:complete len:309 (+),score=52.24 TRINITY_DN10303_c0_g1_i1:92-928(+)